MSITAERVLEIRKKIDLLKTKRDKAEGANEKLIQQLKDDFGISSLEEVQEKIKELDIENESNQKRLDSLSKKIEDVVDWDNI